MVHPVDAHVGGKIRAMRKAAGLSQDALARQIGVSFQQLQKYERGANRVSASMLFDLARALEVDIRVMFDGLATKAPHSDTPLGARLAGDEQLRRLVSIYESLPGDDQRRKLVRAFETFTSPPP